MTNLYTVSGTIKFSHTPASSLTITDIQGGRSTTVTVVADASSATFSFTGLTSGSGTHTVSVLSSATICGSVSQTYAAPVSCTVPATVTVSSATVCAGETTTLMAAGCNGQLQWSGNGVSSTSNSIDVTTSVTLVNQTVLTYVATCTNAAASTSATATVTIVPQPTISLTSVQNTNATNLTIIAIGCTGGELHWSTGQTTRSIVVTPSTTSIYSVTCNVLPGCTRTARIRVGLVPTQLDVVTSGAAICSGQAVTLTASNCTADLTWSNGATGTSIIVSPTLTTGYSVTCSDEINSATATTTIIVSPTPSLSLNASTLTPVDGASVILTASGCQSGTLVWSTGQTAASIIVSTTVNAVYSATCSTGPQCSASTSISLTVRLQPKLTLAKLVSTQRAHLGDIISYTVVLANTGAGATSNVVVRDLISTGLAVVPGSASTSLGTYAPGNPVGLWTIPTLSANGTATLTFSASATAEGVVYNTATIPGDTATVCTSIPIVVCKGSGYAILVSAPEGHTRYQWFRRVGTAQEILVADGAINSYTATEPGEYRVVVDATPGKCPDLSCCPLIIEEDSIPAFTVLAKSPTCVGNQPQPTGGLTLMGLGQNASQYTYAISEGSSFTVTNPAQVAVPADGIILSNLSQAKTYTVRVYNKLGCFRDVTVTVEVNCTCPEAVCVPIVIKKTKTRVQTPYTNTYLLEMGVLQGIGKM